MAPIDPQHSEPAASDLWSRALPMLSQAVNSDIAMNTWIKPLKPVALNEHELVLLAPDAFICSYARQYESLFRNTLKVLSSGDLDVKLIHSITQIQPAVAESARSGFTESEAPATGVGSSACELGFHKRYTFDTFIVGSANRFAHAACVAVATQQNANSYNPLFLYGGSGLGKTHLMHAIGNHVRIHFPHKKLIYIQCEQFVNEFINTITSSTYNSFREKYRNCDLLMIDDIQFIEGKEQMQVEFFHTFNTLYEQGSNIILTCDKPPHSLSTLEERLRTRFASGLIVDIQKPDYETRVAILNQRFSENQLDFPPEVIDYIAANIDSNIRELEGACSTVMAYASLSGSISLSIAADALKDIIHPGARVKVTDQTIIDIVCRFYDITKNDMKSKRRNNDIAYPRQIAMYLLRSVLDMTYEQIAKVFGNHYSTVMHSCEKIEKMIRENSQTADDIQNIKQSIAP